MIRLLSWLEALGEGGYFGGGLPVHDHANSGSGGTGVVGTYREGTAYTLNPWAASTASGAVAHGLGAIPDFYKIELECLTTQGNIAVGQKLIAYTYRENGVNYGLSIVADATNFYVSTGVGAIYFLDRNVPAGGIAMTAANFRAIITPCKKY